MTANLVRLVACGRHRRNNDRVDDLRLRLTSRGEVEILEGGLVTATLSIAEVRILAYSDPTAPAHIVSQARLCLDQFEEDEEGG